MIGTATFASATQSDCHTKHPCALACSHERCALLDKRVAQLGKEKELIEKKMQRIEKVGTFAALFVLPLIAVDDDKIVGRSTGSDHK